MTIAHVDDGQDADPDQYNDLADAVNNLTAIASTTGGTVGDSEIDANEGWKESTGELDGSGSVTVTHGLGFTPRVWIQLRGNPNTSGPYMTYVSTITSTTFIVFFGHINSSGAWVEGASGQSVTFDWLGKKGDSV